MHQVDEYALPASNGQVVPNMGACFATCYGDTSPPVLLLVLANLVKHFTGARVVWTSLDVYTTLAGVVQLGDR